MIRPAAKDSQNTFTNSSYASIGAVLDAIEPALAEVGLLAYSCLEAEAGTGRPCATTVLMDVETGCVISSSFPLAATDPQKIAAAVTYARRVNLVALLNLRSADDDGNSAGPGAPPAAAAGGWPPAAPPAGYGYPGPAGGPPPNLF